MDDPADAPAEVDVSLVHWMLSLTYEERLEVLQGFVDSAYELSLAVGAS